jgi:ATP-binding cassette subfamily B protein
MAESKEKNKAAEQLNLQKKRKKNEKISFSYNLKEYLSLLKDYKWMAVLLVITQIIIDSTRLVDRFLFKILVDKGTEYTAGILLLPAMVQIIIGLIIAFFISLGVKVVFKWFNLHFMNRLDANLVADMKRKYFNHIIGLSHGFHTNHKTGSLIARLSRGGRAMEKMTDTLMWGFAPVLISFIISIISLAFFDIKTTIVLTLLMFVFIGYSFWNQRVQENANLKANEAEDIEKATISDVFTNVSSVKYFGKEQMIKSKFQKVSENSKKAMLFHWDYFRWLDSIQSFIVGLGTFFMLYFPIKAFLAGTMELGTVVFIYTTYFSIADMMFRLVFSIRDYYRLMADFEDLFQYGKVSNDIKDKPNARDAQIKDGEIEFRNMTFSYGNRKIFDKLNLKIGKNEKIALVGHSGSGKTTLVKLLYRFYDLDSGKILIDGQDISDFKQESLRSELSIVPQEGILFDDTIYNNIAFSNPKASRQEVFAAIKFAQLDDFVSRLPNKENTIVGERGVKLSGGEKQRVSIARALLANKKILVLDEATSSLDSKTEHEIQRDFRKLMQGRTSIIIAHRLSTIMSADKIVVMERGKIVQIGKHRDLIKQQGLYKELWNLQKGGYLGE